MHAREGAACAWGLRRAESRALLLLGSIQLRVSRGLGGRFPSCQSVVGISKRMRFRSREKSLTKASSAFSSVVTITAQSRQSTEPSDRILRGDVSSQCPVTSPVRRLCADPTSVCRARAARRHGRGPVCAARHLSRAQLSELYSVHRHRRTACDGTSAPSPARAPWLLRCPWRCRGRRSLCVSFVGEHDDALLTLERVIVRVTLVEASVRQPVGALLFACGRAAAGPSEAAPIPRGVHESVALHTFVGLGAPLPR